MFTVGRTRNFTQKATSNPLGRVSSWLAAGSRLAAITLSAPAVRALNSVTVNLSVLSTICGGKKLLSTM